MAAPSTPVDLPVWPSRLSQGDRVGRCVVDTWHRDGGMAVLYRGREMETGARVAIKVMAEDYAKDPLLVARFEREAVVMRRLSRVPGVVNVIDSGTLLDGRRYLVMEWINGEDLSDVLELERNQETLLDIARACRLVRDVARALASAHARQVVHRDLKPSNVMLDRRDGVERARVVDFGVSADLGSRDEREDLTTTGSAIGTSGYMAPEQALGLAADPALDVWALGALLFELLTTTAIPPGVGADRSLDVRERRAGVPESLANLVRACLAMDMQQRPTAAEVAARLDAILGQLAIAGLPEVRDDDRPHDASGLIERSDPSQLILPLRELARLGLEVPPRITPVRVAAVPITARTASASRRCVAKSQQRAWRWGGAVIAGVALVIAAAVAAATAWWPRHEPTERPTAGSRPRS